MLKKPIPILCADILSSYQKTLNEALEIAEAWRPPDTKDPLSLAFTDWQGDINKTVERTHAKLDDAENLMLDGIREIGYESAAMREILKFLESDNGMNMLLYTHEKIHAQVVLAWHKIGRFTLDALDERLDMWRLHYENGQESIKTLKRQRDRMRGSVRVDVLKALTGIYTQAATIPCSKTNYYGTMAKTLAEQHRLEDNKHKSRYEKRTEAIPEPADINIGGDDD